MVEICTISHTTFFKTLNIHIPRKNRHLTHFRQKCIYNIFALSHRDVPLKFKLLPPSYTIVRYVYHYYIFYHLL